MDGFVNWLNRLGNHLIEFSLHHINLLKDPESMVALFIITLWAVLAAASGGLIAIGFLLTIAWILHALSVEGGNHVVLWLTTAAILVLIVIASETVFDGLSPVLLAAAGATALGYNELIRVNYARRRNAVVRDEIFHASGLAISAAAAIGIIGVALATAFSTGAERSWLWMPAAVGALMLIGFGLAIGPARRASHASRERWQPGDRIPPQPLGTDDLEQF